VLKTFGFDKIKFELSVKGSDTSKLYLGEEEDWQKAESALAAALDARVSIISAWRAKPLSTDRRFDFKIEDAIGRLWATRYCAVGFQSTGKIELEYIAEDNKPHRPVMVHRALFGSIERFFGVLIEHYAGAFPMWLAPVQVAVLPITDRVNEYAEKVAEELRAGGLRVEVNVRSDKIGAKIRDSQLQKIRSCWCSATARCRMER